MIERPENVRIATVADEDAIYDIVVDLRRTAPTIKLLPYRPEKVIQQIQRATRDGQGVIGVIDGQGRIDASVGLFHHIPWWTDVPIFSQVWLYARPTTVGMGYGEALLRFVAWTQQSMSSDMAKYAKENGESVMPFYIDNSHTTGGRLAAKDRLFGKYGERVGSVFLVGMPKE